MSVHEMRNMRTLMGVYNAQDEGFTLHHLRFNNGTHTAQMWIQPNGCDETFMLDFETLESFIKRFPTTAEFYYTVLA